ncbi:MAG: hypothetical protein JNM50_12800 [Chromatiales bacterium]|nr:hypothetical protein [Chromatiales bacterium]
MRVLVACETSGRVREAFRARGHDAWSCDLLPADDGSPFHWKGDVLTLLDQCRSDPEFWPPFDLMVAHPPCTYLAASGLHWNRRRPGRAAQTAAALDFVRELMRAPVRAWAIENPVGAISTAICKPDQIIHPWQFGDDASKATCLWLKGLPLLRPTNVLPGGRKARRANQTASGQNRLPPSPDRWKLRSVTYPGIAAAMADQWGAALAGREGVAA